MKKIIYISVILFVTGLLIAQGEKAINYSREAIFLCTDMIIPSLFPFFVCTGILIYSGFCEKLAVIFAPVMKPLFNVNANGSSAFVLGIISGYPLGAVTACDLYKTGYISKSETERLLAFCNNSGPLFILGSVGIGLYAGLETGIILYTSHILGAVLVGIMMRSYGADKHIAPEYKISSAEKTFSEIFKIASTNAVNSMLLICGTILFFSVASRLALDLIPLELPPFIYGLFEFSGGNVIISSSGYPIPLKLVMSSVVTGFAGLSVHMQVLAVTSGMGLSMKPYIYGKILHGLFSGAITAVILKFTEITPVFREFSVTADCGFMMAGVYTVLCVVTIAVMVFALFLKRIGNKT